MKFTVSMVILGAIAVAVMMPSPRPANPAAGPVAAPMASPGSTASAPVPDPAPLPQSAGFGETVVQRDPSGHFLAMAEVNYTPIRFVVDTGADTVALTQADAQRANVPFDPGQFAVIGRGASGPVRGQVVTIATITLDGKPASNVRAVVLESGDQSLLGHSYLRQLNSVEISGDVMRLR